MKERASKVGKAILNYYIQVYSNYSDIEHHSFLFGQYYIDPDKCEPRENLYEIKKLIFFNPELLLYLYRGLFLVMLRKFNIEFKLEYSSIISDRLRKHTYELEKIETIK